MHTDDRFISGAERHTAARGCNMAEQKKILIVDDEPDVRKVLEKRLSAEGFQIVAAENGMNGLLQAVKEQPDLILLDVDMPDIDGGEVAARLKENGETSHIPIIFLTCLYTRKDGVVQGSPMGDRVFMGKPYKPEELLEQIRVMTMSGASS
jgi:two-component system sensor histidine kinase/response regulator